MLSLLLLVPMALVAVAQLIAAIGMFGEARAHGLEIAVYLPSWILYVTAFASAVLSIVFAGGPIRLVVPLAALTAVAAVTGPLLWGHAIHEFHLLHHLVRSALLAIALVFYFWYVHLHR